MEADAWYGSNWDTGYYLTNELSADDTDDGYVYIVVTAGKDYTDSPGFRISSVEE